MNEQSVTLYFYITELLEVITIFLFFGRLAGRKAKPVHYLTFAALAEGVLCLQGPALLKFLGIGMLLLSGGRFLYGLRWEKAALYAVTAVETIHLSYGLVNALSDMLLQMIFVHNPALVRFPAMVAGGPAALVLAYLCCCTVSKYFLPSGEEKREYEFAVLLPFLMIFLVSGYMDHAFYGGRAVTGKLDLRHMGISLMLFCVRLLGMASLFCVGRIYRSLTESLEIRRKVPLLEQAVHDQRQYVAEAQTRFESTIAFRHDLKNHLLVIKGLLDRGEGQAAERYLERVEEYGRELAFPCHTGYPVLDILIGRKLGEAERAGIKASCTLKLPAGVMDDVELSIIISNALDNAIHACGKLDGIKKGFVNISGHCRGDFLLIRVENTYDGKPLPPEGTGLGIIRRTAEKYHGSVNIEKTSDIFALSVLLIIGSFDC